MDIIQKLSQIFNEFTTNVTFTVTAVVSIIVFACLYFFLFKMLLNNKADKVVWLYAVVILAFGVLFVLSGEMSGMLFIVVPITLVIVTVVLYSTEIKRHIWGKKTVKSAESQNGEDLDEEKIKNSIDEIIKALQDMSKNDVGAIIVLANDNIPLQVLDSGVKVQSDISSELIESIFFPKTPLHDGAMIINGTKIVAAGCFLPLSQNIEKIPKDLGTRHRAGLGITETIDVVSLIVSEESGIISIAKEGSMTRYADNETLRKTLSRYFWQDMSVMKK